MKKTTILFLFITMILSSKNAFSQGFPSDHWKKNNAPIFSGWDENKLEELSEYITDSTAITGMMVVHKGKVVLEYGNISENSYIASCRKSIMSMLYGKHVKNGTINLDTSLKQLEINPDGMLLEQEQTATIRDILSSRSGIFLPAANDGDMIHLAPERGTVKPGEFWLYNNWDFNMAGHIFEKITNQNIYNEIETQFAIPLEMEDWDRTLQEKSGDLATTDILAYHMWFSTRDMARLGVLMLNEGMWNGTKIIEKQWIKEMTTPKSSFEELDKIAPFLKDSGGRFSYGYMWWLWEKPENKLLEGAYTATGAWGQNITVFPQMNTVLAIKTNDLYERKKGDHDYIIEQLTKIYNPEPNKELEAVAKNLEENNISQFIENFKLVKNNSDAKYQKPLNTLGYIYLNNKEYAKAIEIFKLNVETYPSAWNVYDSLGEGFFLNGNKNKALYYFKKAIELNTENQYNNNERLEYIVKRLESNK